MMLEQQLRTLIAEAAQSDERIGPLEENIKWGQPSFTPKRRNVGSSVRLQNNDDGTMSLMFICHTHLVERFAELYPTELSYDGNRAIVVDPTKLFDREAAKHCIALALRYKLKA